MGNTVAQSKQARQKQDNQMEEDTVALARQEREKQGPWEVEVSYGGEADLHKHYNGCDKNPGHHQFVPVDKFNVEHLPPGCQDTEIVDWVRAVANLTVRVSIEYVSEDRPQTARGKPYPCFDDRGGNMMRVGTGLISKVTFKSGIVKSKTCPCQECKNSPEPKIQFTEIYIQTAAHVVYDDMEAAHTTCHLFFDEGGMPEACNGVFTLTGAFFEWKSGEIDLCEIKCVTHDLDLTDKLNDMMRQFNEKRIGIRDKYYNINPTMELFYPSEMKQRRNNVKDLIILVSHPHGCSKQVSVGREVDDDDIRGDRVLAYTTATCPGSSGAKVGKVGADSYYSFIHCGCQQWGENVWNYSLR